MVESVIFLYTKSIQIWCSNLRNIPSLSIRCHKISSIGNIDLKSIMPCDQETQWLTLLWYASRNTNKVKKINQIY